MLGANINNYCGKPPNIFPISAAGLILTIESLIPRLVSLFENHLGWNHNGVVGAAYTKCATLTVIPTIFSPSPKSAVFLSAVNSFMASINEDFVPIRVISNSPRSCDQRIPNPVEIWNTKDSLYSVVKSVVVTPRPQSSVSLDGKV